MKSKYCLNKNGGLVTSFLVSFLLVLLVSCGGNRGIGYVENFEELDQVTSEGRFVIENQWGLPMRGSMMDLTGNTNFIRFKGDSVNLFLPYYGVRHSGGGYGDDVGLEYEGIAEDLRIEKNPNEKNIIMEFEADNGTENLNFLVTLYPDGTTNTSVTSSQRDPISYRGNLRELPEDRF